MPSTPKKSQQKKNQIYNYSQFLQSNVEVLRNEVSQLQNELKYLEDNQKAIEKEMNPIHGKRLNLMLQGIQNEYSDISEQKKFYFSQFSPDLVMVLLEENDSLSSEIDDTKEQILSYTRRYQNLETQKSSPQFVQIRSHYNENVHQINKLKSQIKEFQKEEREIRAAMVKIISHVQEPNHQSEILDSLQTEYENLTQLYSERQKEVQHLHNMFPSARNYHQYNRSVRKSYNSYESTVDNQRFLRGRRASSYIKNFNEFSFTYNNSNLSKESSLISPVLHSTNNINVSEIRESILDTSNHSKIQEHNSSTNLTELNLTLREKEQNISPKEESKNKTFGDESFITSIESIVDSVKVENKTNHKNNNINNNINNGNNMNNRNNSNNSNNSNSRNNRKTETPKISSSNYSKKKTTARKENIEIYEDDDI